MIFLKKIEQFLRRPQTALYLFAFLIFFLILGVALPQKTINPESYFSKLASSQPTLYSLIDYFSLHSYFKSPLFLGLIAIFLVALLLSVIKQCKTLFKVTSNNWRSTHLDHSIMITSKHPIEEFCLQLTLKLSQKLSFRQVHQDRTSNLNCSNYILSKNSVAVLASPLLHGGILLLILVSFYGYFFHSRGFMQIMEGETVSGDNPGWFEEDRGVLAKAIKPPFSIKLNRLTIEYWKDLSQKRVSSNLTLTLLNRLY